MPIRSVALLPRCDAGAGAVAALRRLFHAMPLIRFDMCQYSMQARAARVIDKDAMLLIIASAQRAAA